MDPIVMSKVELMDQHINASPIKMDGKEIRRIVNEMFNINLDTISANGEGSKHAFYPSHIMETIRKSLNLDPASTKLDSHIMAMSKVEAMDRYIQTHGKQITGTQYRTVINDIFGVNLDGISSLDDARLSLFSKGQWIIQHPDDLIVFHTGKGDVDVQIYPTVYFIEITGSSRFPAELHDFIFSFGFSYDPETSVYSYTNPTGESISDAFKVKLIFKIVDFLNLS